MITLDTINKSLQILLGAAVAANQLSFNVSYTDAITASSTTGSKDGITNNTTAVTMVPPPNVSAQRQINSFTVQNADTAAAKVTIQLSDTGNIRSLFVATLNAGDNLVYENTSGFSIFDGTGALKQSTTSSASSSSSSSSSSTAVGGDLSGTVGNATVSKINGHTPATVATSGSFTDLTNQPAIPRKPQIVAAGCALHNASWGNGSGGRSDTRVDSRSLYYIGGNQPISQLQVAASAFLVQPTGEAPVGNDVMFEAALELLSPVTYQRAYVQNMAIASIPNGIPYALSNPLMFDMPAGGSFYLRQSYSAANASELVPSGSTPSPSGSVGYVSSAPTSQVAGTGAYSAPTGSAGFGGPKAAIIGIPAGAMPSVGYVGDSIADGTGDTADSNGNIGFIARGLWSVNGHPVASLKQTVGSWVYGKCTVDTSPRLRAFWPFLTHVIFQLSTNDIASATTLSALQTLATQAWQAAKRTIGPYGKPLQVAQTLTMPRTTSTDNFATAANQTPVAGFAVGTGVRDLFNAWVKTQVGQGLLDAYIDPNQYVEDQAHPGCWISNGSANYATLEGIHPTTALHILAAQAVNAWALTIAP